MTKSVQGPERLAALSVFAQAFVAEYKEKPHPPAVPPGTGCMLCYFVALAEEALASKPLASLLVSRERLREKITADPDMPCEAGSGVSLPDSGDAPRAEPPGPDCWPHDPSWSAWEQGGEWWVGNVATDGAMQLGEFFGPLNERHASRLATLLRAALGSAPPEPWSTQELYHVTAEVRHRGSLDNAVSYLRDALNRVGSAPRGTPEDPK